MVMRPLIPTSLIRRNFLPDASYMFNIQRTPKKLLKSLGVYASFMRLRSKLDANSILFQLSLMLALCKCARICSARDYVEQSYKNGESGHNDRSY